MCGVDTAKTYGWVERPVSCEWRYPILIGDIIEKLMRGRRTIPVFLQEKNSSLSQRLEFTASILALSNHLKTRHYLLLHYEYIDAI